ncbi:MAG: hypothetical protein ACXVXE_16005 [Nocardioidaceae bacterium]
MSAPDGRAALLEWVAALDDLERSLDAVDDLLVGTALELPPWQPPLLTGPLPTELAPRARRLQDRQQGLVARVRAALPDLRQRLALLGRVSGAVTTPRGEQSVYLDITA